MKFEVLLIEIEMRHSKLVFKFLLDQKIQRKSFYMFDELTEKFRKYIESVKNIPKLHNEI